MDAPAKTFSRPFAWTGAALMALAVALAAAEALGGGPGAVLAWVGVGAAALGAGLLAVVAAGRPNSGRALMVAAVPVCYLVLSTAPMAVTRDVLAVARLAAAAATVLVYARLAAPLAARLQYGVCCGCLGVAAAFFLVWEPPPPRPAPIAKPLAELERVLPQALTDLKKVPGIPEWWPGWKGQHTRLPESIEKVLGADEYLNLELTSSDGVYRVLVFITYNANAMTNIPHVPWVCMTQAGFRLVSIRQDDMQHPTIRGKELRPNVILFEPGEGMGRQNALMFQYFNIGGTYESGRQLARILATSGSIGRRGSFLSQTQVAVWFPPAASEDPLAKTSRPYTVGMECLKTIVPLLETQYYPDLSGTEGG